MELWRQIHFYPLCACMPLTMTETYVRTRVNMIIYIIKIQWTIKIDIFIKDQFPVIFGEILQSGSLKYTTSGSLSKGAVGSSPYSESASLLLSMSSGNDFSLLYDSLDRVKNQWNSFSLSWMAAFRWTPSWPLTCHPHIWSIDGGWVAQSSWRGSKAVRAKDWRACYHQLCNTSLLILSLQFGIGGGSCPEGDYSQHRVVYHRSHYRQPTQRDAEKTEESLGDDA